MFRTLLDKVKPTSTAGIREIIDLCDVFQRYVILNETDWKYKRGRDHIQIHCL